MYSSSEEEETAYHEAGHAVMGCILGRPPLCVSIVPDAHGNVGQTTLQGSRGARSVSAAPVPRPDARLYPYRTRGRIECEDAVNLVLPTHASFFPIQSKTGIKKPRPRRASQAGPQKESVEHPRNSAKPRATPYDVAGRS
jgi:hypothetical protein